MDYVFKWVNAIATPTNDGQVVLKFLHKNIFTRFGTPRAIVSDEGTHFCNKLFNNLLAKYWVRHKVALAYHPQTNGQAEVSTREVKQILEKIVSVNRKDWTKKLDDAQWVDDAQWAYQYLEHVELQNAGQTRVGDHLRE